MTQRVVFELPDEAFVTRGVAVLTGYNADNNKPWLWIKMLNEDTSVWEAAGLLEAAYEREKMLLSKMWGNQ